MNSKICPEHDNNKPGNTGKEIVDENNENQLHPLVELWKRGGIKRPRPATEEDARIRADWECNLPRVESDWYEKRHPEKFIVPVYPQPEILPHLTLLDAPQVLEQSTPLPASYLITFIKDPFALAFSEIKTIRTPNGKSYRNVLTPEGKAIKEALEQYIGHFPGLSIDASVIMPDHIHFILTVKEPLPKGLNSILQEIKMKLQESYSLLHNADETAGDNLLLPGLHIRRAVDSQHLIHLICWLHGNPRRWAERAANTRYWCVCAQALLGDKRVTLFGNTSLIFSPELITSEALTLLNSSELQTRLESNPTVVTTATSYAEWQCARRAMEYGANIIYIVPAPLPPDFMPSLADKELLNNGRLLYIAPEVTATRPAAVPMSLFNSRTYISRNFSDRLIENLQYFAASICDYSLNRKVLHTI